MLSDNQRPANPLSAALAWIERILAALASVALGRSCWSSSPM
ncbi:MAG: hypothetical protein WCZ72_08325 [Gemmobacter sp.]